MCYFSCAKRQKRTPTGDCRDERDGEHVCEHDGERDSERGSVTLEAAIIVPLMIFVVCLGIYIAFVLYEHAQFQSSAGYSASAVSAAWRGLSQDGAKEQKPADGVGLYHRLLDFTQEDKEKAAVNVAETKSADLSLQGIATVEGDAEYTMGVLGKTLKVSLNGIVTLPNKRVMTTFGYDGVFDIELASKSYMPDFSEGLRMFDYVVDIEKRLEEEQPALKRVASKFEDVLGHIRGYLGGFLGGEKPSAKTDSSVEQVAESEAEPA